MRDQAAEQEGNGSDIPDGATRSDGRELFSIETGAALILRRLALIGIVGRIVSLRRTGRNTSMEKQQFHER
jgi:hypothetical protein